MSLIKEETEVKKDIKWLKDEILTDMRYLEGNRDIQQLDLKYRTLREVVQKINSLDEPETLSEEWIEDNEFLVNDESGVDYTVVESRKLKGLLVPKRDVPAIPNYVAKWISEHHERFDLYPALKRLENNMLSWENVYEWYRENTRNFVNAYLTGEYEVEEEQKYLANILDEGTGAYLIYYPKSGNYGVTGILDDSKGITRFTEQEIKDYDERFWPFAVKVEELEE